MSIEKILKDNLKLPVDWLWDNEGNKIDVYTSSYWTANTKQEYNKYVLLIDNYTVDNELFSLSAWCDISGYRYWVIEQEEPNYVSLDVVIKKALLSMEEVYTLQIAIEEANDYFENNLRQVYE